MSRSYKHTPYIGDTKTKRAKRQANKLVRSKFKKWNIQDSPHPSWYKKISESWNICDYYDITTWYEHMRYRAEISEWGIPISNMIFTPDGEIDWDNEYKLWQKWYIRKQMTLYKFQLLLQSYPILNIIIKNVYVVQQGQSPKSTYVQIEYKDFVNK